jgi:hypothetical protein
VPAYLTPTPKINTTQNDQLNILFLQGVGVEKGTKRGGGESIFLRAIMRISLLIFNETAKQG